MSGEPIERQYAALGRFVECFEAMVGEARQISIDLMSTTDNSSRLVSMAMHHQNLNAKTIYDICRAVMIESIMQCVDAAQNRERGIVAPPPRTKSDGSPVIFNQRDVETFNAASSLSAGEYGRLSNKRNNLLHASWFIDIPDLAKEDADEFYVSKPTVGADGLTWLTLPKTVTFTHLLPAPCLTVLCYS